MIKVKHAAPAFLRDRRFVLLNAVLLLIYGWTLTESATIRLSVQPGLCTAHTPERRISISCSGLYRGSAGLYSSPDPIPDNLDGGPLDWLAPASAWADVSLHDGEDRILWRETFRGTLDAWRAERGLWRTRLGELRPPSGAGLLVYKQPLPQRGASFHIQARIQRPYDNAGLLLLQPGDQDGWAFITTASERRGVWWRWQDGRLAEPLVGIPYQKPALAQLQSLLRRVLIAHQVALILIALTWLLRAFWRRLAPEDVATRLAGNALLFAPCGVRALAALLALATFAITVHVAIDVLQAIPHVQDSITYLFQGKILARGQLTAPAPPLPQAFAQEFLLVRGGRWFGKYPPGYPALLAPGVLLNAPWIINPLLATLTTPLLYALARRLYPASRTTALLASALPVASPFFLFMSGSHMPHPAELFWIALCMVLWRHALHKPRAVRAALGAGIAFGALFLTRQLSAVAAALPFLLFTLAAGLRDVQPTRRSAILRQSVRLALAALPFLLLLLGYQWALSGDPLQDPRLLYWDFDRLGFGQDSGAGQNAFELALTPDGMAQVWFHDPTQPPRGHSPARGLYNIQQNWQALERDLFGWLPAVTLAFAWLVFLFRRPHRQDWALLFLFSTLLIAYVFYWADGISYGPRYLYVALPALFLLTARGAQVLTMRLDQSGTPQASRLAVGTLLILLIGGAALLNGPNYLDGYRGYNFVDRHSLDLIAQQASTPALVLVDPGTDWWHYGAVFSANRPWLDGPIVVARDLGPQARQRLVQNFPGRHVYLLADEGLRALGDP